MGSSRLTGGAFNSALRLSRFPNKLLHTSCSCKRRFQVTKNATGTNNAVETVLAVPDYERDLISNVHLKQDRCIRPYACNRIYVPWLPRGRRRLALNSEESEGHGVTLLEIMQQQITSSDYAFLFAGQTSIENEKVSDEAIHLAAATLAAGYRGVWKKTWYVKDQRSISTGPRFDETTSGATGIRDVYNPQA